ncbi:hypothetical protein VHEMI08577 [[Torrubiella] hemipterigena]|uniref:G-patch domain-containing protein n=1 Tax=[Torrubiella] hemipterigena TaxID=1531966 RepID=A0A0A1TNP6_9HYPO|nr:hypothetical protein VHEMI08577 [[Torrubiella] hemipterigena]
MAAPPPPPPPPPPQASKPFSLYDNLVDPNDPSPPAAISSAPVLYNQSNLSDTAAPTPAKKPIDAALRFQPIRRPQTKQTKSKATFPKASPKATPTSTAQSADPKLSAPPTTTNPPASLPKSSLADWAPTEEDEWRYGTVEKHQRGGRKKRNKKRDHQNSFETDWDEIYDPSRATNIDEYMRSDEKIDEVRQWKALLYRHRRKSVQSDLSDSEEDRNHRPQNQFAPPPAYGAVPPPPSTSQPPRPPPSTSRTPIVDDETGDDAYARRLALSSAHPLPSHPEQGATTISAAPVRYENAAPPSSPSPPPVQPSAKSTFAHRVMSKYGWKAGTGLGANSTGIVTPLHAQVEKRRKKADADGGGWAEPAGKGKILGGHRAKEEHSKFGPMSDVIVLKHMLDNLPDLQSEISDGLGQEIGQECGEKYGRVERLYIDVDSRQVFIKFTSSVSALRAVNDLDGRVFNGNTILPAFYNADAFERGSYN